MRGDELGGNRFDGVAVLPGTISPSRYAPVQASMPIRRELGNQNRLFA